MSRAISEEPWLVVTVNGGRRTARFHLDLPTPGVARDPFSRRGAAPAAGPA
jgi:hypothetical protein